MKKTVTATKAAYDDKKHRALLERIQPVVGVDTLAGRIQRGQITLFEVHLNGAPLGVFVARSDRLVSGETELVILHAAAVSDPPVPLTSVLDPLWCQVAKDHGMQSIRVHSDQKGLDRLLRQHNFEFQESIFRKALK